jgi:drug/metabolite transporter (DMT)-like permease
MDQRKAPVVLTAGGAGASGRSPRRSGGGRGGSGGANKQHRHRRNNNSRGSKSPDSPTKAATPAESTRPNVPVANPPVASQQPEIPAFASFNDETTRDTSPHQQEEEIPAFALKESTTETSRGSDSIAPSPAVPPPTMELEYEEDTQDDHDSGTVPLISLNNAGHAPSSSLYSDEVFDHDRRKKGISPSTESPLNGDMLYRDENKGVTSPTSVAPRSHDLIWLLICFSGIMASFVGYGLMLEYSVSGGRKLHELSFLFVTSALYTLTAAAGRYVRDETPSTIPPARFAILGLTSMGSTFCSVRSLRYVIYPIQVLAKSCKPVPVMLMGALMGKKYPFRKYFNVGLIVLGVALFMGGGDNNHDKKSGSDNTSSPDATLSQLIGLLLLFISLCFDGGTGAYEDKLMSVHSVQPFDLMCTFMFWPTGCRFISFFSYFNVFLRS